MSVARGSGWEEGAGGKRGREVGWGGDERGAHHGARHKAAENLPMRQGLKQRLANILKRQEKNYVLKKQVNK